MFPKSAPGVITRRQKRLEAEQALKEAYADVDRRDMGYCVVTGRYTSPGAVDARVRREHHHLIPRSLDSTRITDPTNIVTVCAEAHALFKAGWLVSEGDDASKPVFFHWTPSATTKPFEIKTRRHAHAEAD